MKKEREIKCCLKLIFISQNVVGLHLLSGSGDLLMASLFGFDICETLTFPIDNGSDIWKGRNGHHRLRADMRTPWQRASKQVCKLDSLPLSIRNIKFSQMLNAISDAISISPEP